MSGDLEKQGCGANYGGVLGAHVVTLHLKPRPHLKPCSPRHSPADIARPSTRSGLGDSGRRRSVGWSCNEAELKNTISFDECYIFNLTNKNDSSLEAHTWPTRISESSSELPPPLVGATTRNACGQCSNKGACVVLFARDLSRNGKTTWQVCPHQLGYTKPFKLTVAATQSKHRILATQTPSLAVKPQILYCLPPNLEALAYT